MNDERLPASLEAAGFVRRAEAQGDFATILKRGDPDRGALVIAVTSRGRHVAFLERTLDIFQGYQWREVGPRDSTGSAEIADFLQKRARFDPDSWLIELDIADPERFIAETIPTG